MAERWWNGGHGDDDKCTDVINYDDLLDAW